MEEGGQRPVGALSEAACSAFALGWNVAELHGLVGVQDSASTDTPFLPLTGELTTQEQRDHLVARVKTKTSQLHDTLSTQELRNSVSTAAETLAAPHAADDVRAGHTALLSALMASDSRLGKAYGLGLALCQVCRPPSDGESAQWSGPEGLGRVKRHLAELHTVLPDHAAMGVLGSLSMWERLPADTVWRDPAVIGEQARTWRALLSGEKSATQDLGLADYAYAAGQAVHQGQEIGGRVLSAVFSGAGRIAVFAALVLVLVVGVLITQGVFGTGDSGAQAVGGGALVLFSGASGLGLAKKAWDGIESVWDTARPALMAAALDITVAAAITQLPEKENTNRLRMDIGAVLHPTGLTRREPE